MSFRRLGVLLRHLPPESATNTAIRSSLTEEQLASLPEPEGHGPWSSDMHLLASIADGVQILAWQQSQIHGGSKAKPPDPIPRPGIKATNRLTAEQRALLEASRRRDEVSE